MIRTGEHSLQRDIQIIFPSGVCQESILEKNIEDLNLSGFNSLFKIPSPHPEFPFLASTTENRVMELTNALLESSDRPILCGRGGYGASDLLLHLPWSKLKKLPPKWLIGFSDITALQSAFFSKLGWPSIHGPMPGTELWGQNGRKDIDVLFRYFRNLHSLKGNMSLHPISHKESSMEGWLFGGCLSVLCTLIGTPYFPHSLRGAIFLLEDTGEHPGRILRMFNQFIMSGILESASALVLGNLGTKEFEKSLHIEISKKVPIPVYSTQDFGHVSPNMPWVLGANAYINEQNLYWTYGS